MVHPSSAFVVVCILTLNATFTFANPVQLTPEDPKPIEDKRSLRLTPKRMIKVPSRTLRKPKHIATGDDEDDEREMRVGKDATHFMSKTKMKSINPLNDQLLELLKNIQREATSA